MVAPNSKQWASVVLFAAGGGALVYVEQHIASIPSSASGWVSFVLGVFIAAAASVKHLYDDKPGSAPSSGASP